MFKYEYFMDEKINCENKRFVSLGNYCITSNLLKDHNLKFESYPFDWLWCPAKTTYSILELLTNKSSYDACQYMTTGYSYYIYEKPEHFKRVNYITNDQMNPTTGLGITHDIINDDYRVKLTRRLERLLERIKSGNKIVFIYTDATNKNFNYHLDDTNIEEYESDSNIHHTRKVVFRNHYTYEDTVCFF